MEIGIIGLPNVGKSTLFNALTGAGAAAENFPFTTIEPNVGIVPLPDPRLYLLAEKHKSAKNTPAGIRFVDIAGLVKGANQGEGLGNKFLANIRNVDAVAHVIRCFKDENVASTLSESGPLNEAQIIETELLLADLQQAQKLLEKYAKPAKTGDSDAKEKAGLIEQAIGILNEGKPLRTAGIPLDPLKEFQFLTAKPLIYIANLDENNGSADSIAPLRELAKNQGTEVVTISAKIEAEILELPQEDQASYYEDAGITTPSLEILAGAGKRLLNLICFFTSNENETRAWLVPKGSTASKAAGKIHTDMERGFIRAEVFNYDNFAALGSESALREKGLLMQEGKDYLVKEGDVLLIKFSV